MSARWWTCLLVLLGLAALGSLLLPVRGLAEIAQADAALGTAILLELRLPRMVLAALYGAVLGSAGAAIQALFSNPLASPDITGSTGGAALGTVTTAYLLGATSPVLLAVGGVAGALLALVLLLGLAGSRSDTATLLLAGVAISALAGAGTALALALAPSPFAFYEIYDWLMGSLVDRSLLQAAIVLVPVVIALMIFFRERQALDMLVLGEATVEAMGYRLPFIRRRIIAATAIGVGSAVAVCGAVGFVGLVAPIFARRLTSAHPGRAVLPAALIGAILLLLADLGTRLLPSGRLLPVGVVTALIGAPIFIVLVLRMRGEWRR